MVKPRNARGRRRLLGRDPERGSGLVEYIFVIAFLVLAVVGSMQFFSTCMAGKFNGAGNAIETGTAPPPQAG